MAFLDKFSQALTSEDSIAEKTPSLLTRDFIIKHAAKLGIIIVAAWLYIGLRYNCEASLYHLNQLKEELNDVRYTTIARWGELTGKNKPDIIRRKVLQSDITLEAADEPPIRVK